MNNNEKSDANFPKKKVLEKYILAALVACIGGMSIGTGVGYSSPALPSLEEPDSGFQTMTEEQKSWVASIFALGALFGGLAGGPLIERFGRKTSLVFSSIPFVGGWLLIGLTGTVTPMLIGRVITGFCAGLVCLTIPVYISETAAPHLRGFLGTFLVMFCFLGVLLVYVLGIVLNWSWLALVMTSIPIANGVGMLFMPESPRWLVKRGQRSKAISAILFLNGTSLDPEIECREMEANALEQPVGNITIKEALRPSVIKPVGISLMLMLFQQWVGFNGVLFFAGSIFKDSGYTSISPALSSIILALAQLGGTIMSSFIIDRAGRRILLLFSGIVMFMSLTALSILEVMVEKHGPWVTQEFGWVTVVSLCVYVTSFAMGFGPIPWVVMGEVLPVRFRGIGSSLTTAFCWGNGFLVAKTFLDMRNGMTVYGAYFFYDFVCVLAIVFVAICLPETKGKSLEEIERLFEDKLALHEIAEDEDRL